MSQKLISVKKIWRETFNDSPEWIDMYFSRVYSDDDAFLLEADGQPVSSLILSPYTMILHGREVPVSYLSGAATRRLARGNGHMSRLLSIALRQACHRGDYLVSLIPASRRLFGYYARRGFATVFYINEQRYTSLHSFPVAGSYSEIADLASDAVFDAFHRLEAARDGSIIHSRRDFDTILLDNALDGGDAVAISDDSTGEVAAIAFAVAEGSSQSDGRIVVRRLLAVSPDAEQAILRVLRSRHPSSPFTVIAPVEPSSFPIEARGMVRIVNAGELLRVYAEAAPSLSMFIRVSDPLIPDNNRIFRLHEGRLSSVDHAPHLDLDVSVEVLAAILFSTPRIGDVFSLPSVRPHMALMLE